MAVVCLAFLCLMHMKCIVISFLCGCNLCIHPCFVGFGNIIFYDYLQKNVLFSGGKVVRKFGAKSSKKADLYANG